MRAMASGDWRLPCASLTFRAISGRSGTSYGSSMPVCTISRGVVSKGYRHSLIIPILRCCEAHEQSWGEGKEAQVHLSNPDSQVESLSSWDL